MKESNESSTSSKIDSADALFQQIANKVIADLAEITDTLSGEGSELTNMWEEICVQEQRERSVVWEEVYELTINSLIEAHLDNVSVSERQRLWLETEQGLDWQCGEDYENGFEPPIHEQDIVEHLANAFVLAAAETFSNSRIAAFLLRFRESD